MLYEDCNGYIPVPDYLTFHGKLSQQDLDDCYSQQRPLGMTDPQFFHFKDSLVAALLRDGITFTPEKCDVRLKGSSAGFYSGWHKLMPYHREVLRDVFLDSYKRAASEAELDSIEAEVKRAWPNKYFRPVRKPFDALSLIGINPTPIYNLSDYDVQVSSDEIGGRVAAYASVLGIPPVAKPDMGFYDTEIVAIVCPELDDWTLDQTTKLGRNVSVRVFKRTGPDDKTATIGHLSSHFRDPWGPGRDWRIP